MPTTKPKGNRRYQVLAAIKRNRRATYRDLCHACGIKSTSHLHYYLRQLKEEGLILWEPKLARSITLPGEEPIVRMDPRKNNNQATRAKKSAAGRKSRILEMKQTQKDPDLQRRIEAIGLREDARKALGAGLDVVRDYPRGFTLRATRIG
jgi:hypothetical protein